MKRSLFLLLLSLFSFPLSPQGATWVNEVDKRTGETITITWEYSAEHEAQITAWSLYRQTGVSAKPYKVAEALPASRQFVITMPGGTTQQYRLLVRPVKGALIGPAGTELIVNRLK